MTAPALPRPDAPIGVFDSGVGGLSVLAELRARAPALPLVYVADSGHAPYGDRTAGVIEQRVQAIGAFLLAQGARAIVVACHTATVMAVQALRAACPVPVIAMEPAIKPAVAASRRQVVAVLATARTVQSEWVARAVRLHGGGARVLLQGCPGLVERIEGGDLDSPGTRELLRRYLEPVRAGGADTVVLGCTHYEFVADAIREACGPGVTLVSPRAAVAREVLRRVGGSADTVADPAPVAFYTSAADLQDSARVMSQLWGQPVQPVRLPV